MKIKFIRIVSFLLFFSFQFLFAQEYDQELKNLQEKLNNLESQNTQFVNQIKSLEKNLTQKLNSANDSIQNLKMKLQENEKLVNRINQQLQEKISTTESISNQKIQTLDDSIGKNTLYWIIAVLSIALFSILLFSLLRKQLTREKTDLSENIKQTRKALEEEGIKLDNKLVDLLSKQMELMKKEHQSMQPNLQSLDHSLALKVADEVVRIQMNLSNMDQNVKGITNLKNRVVAIMDNFIANGYEIVDLLNKPYDQGMNIVATMEPDENLEAGKQVIKRIIKPQINFKGQMIQAAQVVVAYGE